MMQVQVGDEVGFGRYHSFGGQLLTHGFSTVTKVNHHGHVHLANGRVFDKHGRERNVQYGGLRLMQADDLRAQLNQIAQNRARVQAAQQLKQLIDGQRNGFGDQIQIDDETRNRMIALVNQL